MQPEGYVSAANAEWLLQRIQADRRIGRRTEFEALLAIMAWARSVPDSLTAFALGLLKDAIVEGDPRLVDANRVPGSGFSATMSRRCAGSSRRSGEGFGHVTRREAESLFAIAEGSDPLQPPVFCGSFRSGHRQSSAVLRRARGPEVDEALRRERWLDERQSLSVGIGLFLSHV